MSKAETKVVRLKEAEHNPFSCSAEQTQDGCLQERVGSSQSSLAGITLCVSYCAQHFTIYYLFNPMRIPGVRHYYNAHFLDEETEVQRGRTAGKQQRQDFEPLHPDSELSSLPDKVETRNVV